MGYRPKRQTFKLVFEDGTEFDGLVVRTTSPSLGVLQETMRLAGGPGGEGDQIGAVRDVADQGVGRADAGERAGPRPFGRGIDRWVAVGAAIDPATGRPNEKPSELAITETILNVAERFGQSPFDVMDWDVSVLQMLAIEARGRREEEV
jgi:hypothetical protein